MYGKPPSIARDWAHVYGQDNLENVLIAKDGKRVVSSVATWVNDVAWGKVTMRVGGINCLTTLPEYRHQGLGSLLMRSAHRHLASLYCQVGLLGTQITNWYRRLGWELAGRARSYRFDRANIVLLPPLPPEVEAHWPAQDHLAGVVQLRNDERLGGIRQLDSFQTILAARGNPQIISACQHGQLLAFLLARERKVIEWGGPPRLVAGLLRTWFERTDDLDASTSTRDEARRPLVQDQVTVVAPGGGHRFVEMLDRVGIPHSRSYVGMMYLVAPEDVLRVTGNVEIALLRREAGFSLSRAREHVDLSQRELTKLFFGPERVHDFASDIFPLPFWQWPLDHV
jgi:ribosomal protein S18 acetylase RimI-like enzyme